MLIDFENFIKHSSWFTHDITWRDFSEKINIDLKIKDSFLELVTEDKIKVFEDCRQKLREIDREKKALEAEANKALEKKQRSDFRVFYFIMHLNYYI